MEENVIPKHFYLNSTGGAVKDWLDLPVRCVYAIYDAGGDGDL